MSKTLSAYGNFSATAIKSRADIPSQSDMVVSGTDVLCENVNASLVINTIQSSCKHLYGYSTSPRVNKWSNFSSQEWYVNSPDLLHRSKDPCALANFAGYNHGAVPARVVTEHSTTLVNITPAVSTFTVTIAINTGEINWPTIAGGTNISKICMKVYDHLGQLKDTKGVAFTMQDGDQIPFLTSNTITSTSIIDEVFYVAIYFGSITEDIIAYYPGIIGTSPVTHHFTVNAKYLGEPTFSISADMSATSFTAQFLTMSFTGSTSSVYPLEDRQVNVDGYLCLIPTFSDCGGLGNYPQFNNSPLIYNADIKLVKGSTGYVYWFYDVVPGGDKECVTYSNIGTNASPPNQRINFSYQLPVENTITYGDNLYVYIKRRKPTFGYAWCNGGVPTIVTP